MRGEALHRGLKEEEELGGARLLNRGLKEEEELGGARLLNRGLKEKEELGGARLLNRKVCSQDLILEAAKEANPDEGNFAFHFSPPVSFNLRLKEDFHPQFFPDASTASAEEQSFSSQPALTRDRRLCAQR
uniref:Uncharacterized protein n=1 Tax=Molossus molossus TaxID=27622 RepID=A0A7J8DBW9_MOLMO|nr:hypothetical protein HJG59_009360 [Molossus molossus]